MSATPDWVTTPPPPLANDGGTTTTTTTMTTGEMSFLSSIEEKTRYVLCCKDLSSEVEAESTTVIDSSINGMMNQPTTTKPRLPR